jgi:hypothetical protein
MLWQSMDALLPSALFFNSAGTPRNPALADLRQGRKPYAKNAKRRQTKSVNS